MRSAEPLKWASIDRPPARWKALAEVLIFFSSVAYPRWQPFLDNQSIWGLSAKY